MVILLAAAVMSYQHSQKQQQQRQQQSDPHDSIELLTPIDPETVFSDQRAESWYQMILADAILAEHSLPNDGPPRGLTLHRLSIGVCARQFDGQAEAALAGIPPDSILIRLNGIAFLAEPTHRAIHRLWYYTQKQSPATETLLTEWLLPDQSVRSVILWTGGLQGIAWAPALSATVVERCQSHPHLRGYLLRQVNENIVTSHQQAAELLQTPTPVKIRCILPAQHWRTSYFEKEQLTETKPNNAKTTPLWSTHYDDGVKVKVYPSVTPRNTTPNEKHLLYQHYLEPIAAGIVAAPYQPPTLPIPSQIPPSETPCREYPNLVGPSNDKEHWFKYWDPFEAWVHCIAIEASEYDVTLYRELLTMHNYNHWTLLQYLVQRPAAVEWIQDHLLQALSWISSPIDQQQHDKSKVTSYLLSLSRKHQDFCQKLYFLLRSYISTLETSGSKNNLVALLHCLELLRTAEKELAHEHGRPRIVVTKTTTTPPAPPYRLGFWRKHKHQNDRKMKKNPPAQQQHPTNTAYPVQERKPGTPRTMKKKDCWQSPSDMYENMSDFLGKLDNICVTVERTLQKSFRQKIAEWALQPWSPSKDTALAEVTMEMREGLRASETESTLLLVNPVESSELLSSIDCDECYILPSAHFPVLLTFNVSERRCSDAVTGEEKIYRTAVKLSAVKGSNLSSSSGYSVQAAIAGRVLSSGPSFQVNRTEHAWGSRLHFETRSSWGAPQTLAIRLSKEDDDDTRSQCLGFGWVDLSGAWALCELENEDSTRTVSCRAIIIPSDLEDHVFDDQGMLALTNEQQELVIELQISLNCISFDGSNDEHGQLCRKRLLLYKHDDDLRQEAFAVQFIRTCDRILQASGLDLKLLTFQCIPVGVRRGFIEWVPGSVPLSEICQPFAGSLLDDHNSKEKKGTIEGISESPSMMSKAGMMKYESLRQKRDLGSRSNGKKDPKRGSLANNPVQEYLRSVAYDADAPYLIRKEVMDAYVKSCAGYSIITYILGVGDRHLDNLLLHQSGCFFHCDYSFLLGRDPKTYIPLRITDDMILGMGGKDSDNYAKFLSHAGAAFLTLRRPEAVRTLLSMVRLMENSRLPDISENQKIEQAILGVRDRLRLDLEDSLAVAFVEDLIESTVSSKMWLAVDAIHTLGKKF